MQSQGSIGPHEGREHILMAAGAKPLAVFWESEGENTIPEERFRPMVDAGTVVRHEMRFSQKADDGSIMEMKVVLFAPTEQLHRIDAALDVLEPVFKNGKRPSADDDARLGRLLGYSEADIAEFLKSSAPRPQGVEPTHN